MFTRLKIITFIAEISEIQEKKPHYWIPSNFSYEGYFHKCSNYKV